MRRVVTAESGNKPNESDLATDYTGYRVVGRRERPGVYLIGEYVDLRAEQEAMRERWGKGNRARLDGKLVPVEYAEKATIDALIARKDLKCPVCRVAPTTVNKTTGELKTCTKCALRNSYLMQKYGLTRKHYNRILHEQGNRCAICLESFEDGLREPCVDYCHDLHHVRGLLCTPCNTLLGAAKENEDILNNAIIYVASNRLERTWSAKALGDKN